MIEQDSRDERQAANHELEWQVLLALRKAKELGLPDADLKILCYQTGIQMKHVTFKPGA